MTVVLRRVTHGMCLVLAVSLLTFTMLELAPGDFFDELQMDATRRRAGRLKRCAGARADAVAGHALLAVAAVVRAAATSASRSPIARRWRRCCGSGRGNTLLADGAGNVHHVAAWPCRSGIWVGAASGQLDRPHLQRRTSTLLGAARPADRAAAAAARAADRPLPHRRHVVARAQTTGDSGARLRDLGVARVSPALRARRDDAAGGVCVTCERAHRSRQAPAVQAARGHGIAGPDSSCATCCRLAANPLVSLAGLSIAALLSASLLIEVVMSWPGLGPLLVEALLARDVHVVLSASMLASAVAC